MTKVVVTGGSSKAGRAVVCNLVAHGFDGLNVNLMSPGESMSPFLEVDLSDLVQTVETLRGADAVVHPDAIPTLGRPPEGVTFCTTIMSTHNVLSAATLLGVRCIVSASSETKPRLPFDRERPADALINEDHPLYSESSYALSKGLSTAMARQVNRWIGVSIVSLRFSTIMEPHNFAQFPAFQNDP